MRVSRPSVRPLSSARTSAREARPARRASSSVIASGSIGSTLSMASTPARVTSVPPAFTEGRRQRRKATVIDPSASPSQSRCANSTSPHPTQRGACASPVSGRSAAAVGRHRA
jgi:hypothetical protein